MTFALSSRTLNSHRSDGDPMKNLFSLCFLLSTLVQAGTFSVVGPCEKTPLFEITIKNIQDQSVGDLTVTLLQKNSIPFLGTPEGINSIFETPTGLEAMEVISDSELMAYGWCYSVNGFEPNLYPNALFLNEGDSVLWWFGYAHYKDGQWITQCTPSYQRRSSLFCSSQQLNNSF